MAPSVVIAPTPQVSVVIPTYNHPAFLLETLESVFAQTFTDFEVVVINDGSTDDTLARLAPLTVRDARLRVITQHNAGTGAARNRGIAEARSDLVALLDHDDLWHPEKLATQVAFMAAHPDCIACVTPVSSSLAPNRPLVSRTMVEHNHGIVDRPMLDSSRKGSLFLTCSTLMFRRSAATFAQFGEERGAIEDVQFYARLLIQGHLGFAGGERPLVIYRHHAANASSLAAYSDRGRALLRRMQRDGAFAGLSPRDRLDFLRWMGFIGQSATVAQVTRGRRWRGVLNYVAELPHQARLRQWKFIFGFPVLVLSPMRWIRKWSDPG